MEYWIILDPDQQIFTNSETGLRSEDRNLFHQSRFFVYYNLILILLNMLNLQALYFNLSFL